jgi:ATP/maltotriose-dependent transcriptional regulator MalT
MDAHPLREPVLDALRRLRQPTELRNSPLLNYPAVRSNLGLVVAHPSPDDLALALANRLNAIIDGLRPAGKENLEQREFLHYYVLHYLFQKDENPQFVQQKLGVGHTHLYKLRNEAVDNVATLLAASPSVNIPVTLSEPIPEVPDFVGRATELGYYREQLARQNLAIVHGFAGAGKTALAARLAAERRQAGHLVIWLPFYAGVNTVLPSFLDSLAYALASLGRCDLQLFLAESAQGTRPYPDEACIQYAVNGLVASSATLCLDDVHLVDADPLMQRLFARLIPRQQPAYIPLIVTSRYFPSFAQGRYVLPLMGLNDADARQLLRQARLDWLESREIAELQQRTEGHPAFIKFFIAWAQSLGLEKQPPAERNTRAHEFITQLGWSPSSRSFLLADVIDALDPVAQSVLDRLALCRKAIGVQGEALAALFSDYDPAQWREALVELEQRNLLIRQEEAGLYHLHDLVRNYVLARLDSLPDHRARLHCLAAAYYIKLGALTEAAYHYCQAGEYILAVELLVGCTDGLIQDGQAATLLALAEQIPGNTLPSNLRLAWYGKLTAAWQSVGKFTEEAVAYLARALELTPQTDFAEHLAALLAQEKIHALQDASAPQAWDLSFLQRLAMVLADKIRQTEIALHRAQHLESSIPNPAAVASARLAVRQAQGIQNWVVEAAGYGRALLMAQQLDDAPAQHDAYNQLGRALTRLGRPQEAAEAYHKAFAWPGCKRRTVS